MTGTEASVQALIQRTFLACIEGLPRLRRGRQLLEEAMARLADSPGLQRSTRDNLDRWAAELRPQLQGKQDDA